MNNQRKQRTAGSTGNGEQLFRAREQLAACQVERPQARKGAQSNGSFSIVANKPLVRAKSAGVGVRWREHALTCFTARSNARRTEDNHRVD